MSTIPKADIRAAGLKASDRAAGLEPIQKNQKWLLQFSYRGRMLLQLSRLSKLLQLLSRVRDVL